MQEKQQKMIEWRKTPLQQKNDLEFITAQVELYESSVEDFQNNNNWLQFNNRMIKLQEKEEKEIEKANKEEERKRQEEIKKVEQEIAEVENEELRAKMVNYWTGWFETNHLYYISDEHCFYEYFEDTGEWSKQSVEAIRMKYNVRGKENNSAFEEVLSTSGHINTSSGYSFKENKPDRFLNMMKTDHWLKPQNGEVSPWFDILMSSLGDNDKEKMDHIEQLVYWKFTHPEEFRIPCLIIYGEGGVGRNTFVTEVLGNIFGSHQAISTSYDMVFGDFSGMIKGKVVVLVDETIADKSGSQNMKRVVGNEIIPINNKGGKQELIENTIWFLAGGNENTGSLILDGGSSDRRWSIFKVHKNIIQRTQEYFSIDDFKDALLKYRKEAEPVYRDSNECAKWLNYLCEKYKDMEDVPSGLQGEDYFRLLEIQKQPIDEYIEKIFSPWSFTHISGTVMYEGYKKYIDYVNPSAKGKLGRNKFFIHVEDWCKKNRPDISKRRISVDKQFPRRETKRTTTTAFAVGSRDLFNCNDEKYTHMTDFHKVEFDLSKLED